MALPVVSVGWLKASARGVDGDAPEEVDLSSVGAVVFAGGFRPDYRWVHVPGAFDDLGFPLHADGRRAVHVRP